MKLKKETIELLESALSDELVKIQQRGGDYPAYHSVRSIAKRVGEVMHWSGQPECEQFKAIMDGCAAIRNEHQEEEEQQSEMVDHHLTNILHNAKASAAMQYRDNEEEGK